jgi:hypothetical protein
VVLKHGVRHTCGFPIGLHNSATSEIDGHKAVKQSEGQTFVTPLHTFQHLISVVTGGGQTTVQTGAGVGSQISEQ